MNLTSTKCGSSSDITQTSSLSAKVKRLQIEESLLLQSINKCVPETLQMDGGIDAKSSITLSEFKAFLRKTKNSYREIKLLFQDIKTSTSSKEVLKILDIDDVKKSTLQLENRIKIFKIYLQTELTGLKSAEQQFHQTINENSVKFNKSKQPRIQTAKYNEIVPSPVKMMMTSPFKCLEVQQFQELMMNSANRYGGWNEYHHNIFINQWTKHFGSQIKATFEEKDNPVESSPAFHLFLIELLPKLQNIREEEIISHVKWYSKYIYLKERQQKAIDKWRSNRKIMKSAKAEPVLKKDSSTRNEESNGKNTVYNYNFDLCSTGTVSDELDIITDLVPLSPNQDEVRKNVQRGIYLSEDVYQLSNIGNLTPKDHEDSTGEHALLHFQKSTKQWCFRINSKGRKITTNVNNLEHIKKLGVPAWRVGL